MGVTATLGKKSKYHHKQLSQNPSHYRFISSVMAGVCISDQIVVFQDK